MNSIILAHLLTMLIDWFDKFGQKKFWVIFFLKSTEYQPFFGYIYNFNVLNVWKLLYTYNNILIARTQSKLTTKSGFIINYKEIYLQQNFCSWKIPNFYGNFDQTRKIVCFRLTTKKLSISMDKPALFRYFRLCKKYFKLELSWFSSKKLTQYLMVFSPISQTNH